MSGIQIRRFRYFFQYFERLAGGQGILPTLKGNKLYYLLLPCFVTAQFFSLLFLIISIKPDLIHAHWLIPQGLLAAFMKRLFGIRVLVTAHGSDVNGLRRKIFIWLKKYVVKNTDCIVTVSKAVADVLAKDVSASFTTEIIPMGVDSELFSPQRRDDSIRKLYNISGPFLLFVGRLTEVKGVQYLIDAVAIVRNEIPDVKLLIIGHGELEGELRKRVEILNMTDNIVFVGGLANRDLPKYYASADIFIGPSITTVDGHSEGFGLTFVEAAMSGCILIGTKVGGIEGIIQEGRTGFLISPGNIEELARTILHVIKKFHTLNEMRIRGREVASDEFEWNIMSFKYKTLMKNIVLSLDDC